MLGDTLNLNPSPGFRASGLGFGSSFVFFWEGGGGELGLRILGLRFRG